ncbi:MAG: hypothetical protein FWD61_06785 [Phycisphaerales bacterium]|nr:hypothetical protein [Phycisphaerales bacterium]
MKPRYKLHRHTADGHQHILHSDDKADVIKAAISSELVDEEFTNAGGRVEVTPVDDGWIRIEITIPKTLSKGEVMENIADVGGNITGKGWYDVRDQGQEEKEDRWVSWYVVKHHNGAPCI